MPSTTAPRIALAPEGAPAWMAEAVEKGGGHLVDVHDAEGLVWASASGAGLLSDLLGDGPGIRWVQLPFAGVEPLIEIIDHERVWTCAKGTYAEPVAELALSLALAGMRGVGGYVRAATWSRHVGHSLFGAQVTILGAGGIAQALVRLLAPFDTHVTVVRNRVAPMDGVDVVVGTEHLHDALPGADLVVLALALTPETEGIVSADELRLMEPHAWLVNVARGRHVDTGALIGALIDGEIGGAALDVVEPEPLPDDHPLWTLPNCLITPHVGGAESLFGSRLAGRITDNVRRFASGEPLDGVVDPELGY